MKDVKPYVFLSNASWLAFFLAMRLLYGGLHPDKVTSNFIYFYAGWQIILLNIPLLVVITAKAITHREFLVFEFLHLVLKCGVGYYLIQESGF